MRLYTFINYYLSSIQQGIQSAHIVSELMHKSWEPDLAYMIKDWAQNHKTIIVCNGGNNESIENLARFFQIVADEKYPYTTFCEDQNSLCGALTGVGIILPEEIYDVEFTNVYDGSVPGGIWLEAYRHKDKIFTSRSPQFDLIKRIKSYRLAN